MSSATGDDADGLARAKATLRRSVRRAREALPPGQRAVEQEAVVERLGELLVAVGAPGTGERRPLVAIYAATGAELALDALVPRLRGVGHRLLLPRVRGEALDLVAWDGARRPGAGHRGVPEPTGAPVPVDVLATALAAVVVPGVAFDRGGGRLGQGGGHYDRLLADLDGAGARPLVVAPAFAVQVVDIVPRGPHDRGVDVLVHPGATQVVGRGEVEHGRTSPTEE